MNSNQPTEERPVWSLTPVRSPDGTVKMFHIMSQASQASPDRPYLLHQPDGETFPEWLSKEWIATHATPSNA